MSYPRLPTRVAVLSMAAALMISLGACETGRPGTLAIRADTKAGIKAKIARACPAPLTNAELERAAVYVLAHAVDLEAVWVVGRLDRMDAETRICRGATVK